jgi:hypothetical protein
MELVLQRPRQTEIVQRVPSRNCGSISLIIFDLSCLFLVFIDRF